MQATETTQAVKAPKVNSKIAKTLEYLQSGRELTHVYAFANFGTMRLASCIEELRNKYGHNIKTTIKENSETGATYASYKLLPSFKVGDKVRVAQVFKDGKGSQLTGKFGDGDVLFRVGNTGIVSNAFPEDDTVRVHFKSGKVWFVAKVCLEHA